MTPRSRCSSLPLLVAASTSLLLGADKKRTPPGPVSAHSATMTGDCERFFRDACAAARQGRSQEALSLLQRSAQAGPLCVTRSLTEPALISLHELRGFRDLMKRCARQSSIRLAPPDEPGEPLQVSGRVVDDDLRPVANALIYVFHTNRHGNYSSTGGNATMGDSLNPRLFGYLRADTDGRYEFRTIRPGGYPGDGPPAHIHYEVRADGFKDLITELLFRDDPRLTRSVTRDAVKSGFVVSDVRKVDGEQRCACDLMMERK